VSGCSASVKKTCLTRVIEPIAKKVERLFFEVHTYIAHESAYAEVTRSRVDVYGASVLGIEAMTRYGILFID